MNKTIHAVAWSLCLLGGLGLIAPTAARALDDEAREQEPAKVSREPDSLERTGIIPDNQAWEQGQAQLQQALQPGEDAESYRRKLEEMGYRITSMNYDDDDYREYEVVKGNQTYEVQIDVDENTHKATAIDIAQNIWKTDATERALARYERTGQGERADEDNRDTPARSRNYQYSERDRSMTDKLVNELEALPVGQDKKFYKNELKKRGYEIAKINTDDKGELEIEAVKDNRSLALNVDFDEDTGKSTDVEASALWWESEAAQRARTKEMGRATDNDEAWERGQAQLQQALKPGQPAGAYRQALEELDYLVTSVNYNNDDYLEYEIVKGDQTYEIQIDVDDGTRKATEIDVAQNVWKTDATERALSWADRDNRDGEMTRGYQYSDRDRSRTDRLVKELEALPVGRDKQFYKQELKKRGYEITKVNTDDQDELELEAVKDNHSLALNVDFDEDSGKSTEVDASTLWWESEATQKARTEDDGSTTIRRTAREERNEQRRMHSRDRDEETETMQRPTDAEHMSEADRAQLSRDAE